MKALGWGLMLMGMAAHLKPGGYCIMRMGESHFWGKLTPDERIAIDVVYEYLSAPVAMPA